MGSRTVSSDEAVNVQQRRHSDMQQEVQKAQDALPPEEVSDTPDKPSTPEQGIKDSFGQMRDASVDQAKAQYDAMLEQEVNELRNAYQQAVTDGEISMAEARRDFEKHKGEIQQDHYRNTEFTNLYGNQMGIQNSQQMMGLQRGDQARASSMHNENRQVKQQRIADVKTRLDGIRNQKRNNIASARAMRDHNVAQATSQANQQYAQQMGQFQSDVFHADREQQFTQDNMHLDDQITRGQMEFQDTMEQNRMQLQAEIDKGLMDHEQAHRLEQMAEQFQIDLSLMDHDQMLQLERMDRDNEHRIEQMGVQFSFDKKLNAQQIAGEMAAINARGEQERRSIQARTASQIQQMEAQFKKEFEAEQRRYEQELERDLRGVTPGTTEYNIIKGNHDRNLEQRRAELEMKGNEAIKNTIRETVTTSQFNSVMEAPSAEGVSRPKPEDFSGGGQSFSNFGGINNTGQSGDDKYRNAIKNHRNLVNNDRRRENLTGQYNVLE